MKAMKAVLAALLIVLSALAAPAPTLATTWAQRSVSCPVCGESLALMTPRSYGSYIYKWPSRFQLVFWPATTRYAWHFCKRCHTSALMGDFQRIPADKKDAIQRAIAKLKAPQKDAPYHEVPVAYRVRIAEVVYQQLGRDDAFWLRFHRLKGYHLDNTPEGTAARRKALALAEKLLKQGPLDPPEKELWLVAASMRYLTGDARGALTALDEVKSARVPPSPKTPVQNAEAYARYLDETAEALRELVKAGKPLPR